MGPALRKENGSPKEEWKKDACSDPLQSTYYFRLPQEERQGPARSSTTAQHSGDCAECGKPSRYMEEHPDSSWIVLPICGQCARKPSYQRSYC